MRSEAAARSPEIPKARSTKEGSISAAVQAEPVEIGEALRRVGRGRAAAAGGEQDQPRSRSAAGKAVGAGHAPGAEAAMPATGSHLPRRRNGFVRRVAAPARLALEPRVGEDRAPMPPPDLRPVPSRRCRKSR